MRFVRPRSRCLVVAMLSLAVSLSATTSEAIPIHFSFEGSGSGSMAGSAFSDASFEVSIDADTIDRMTLPTLFGIANLSGTIDIEGVGNGGNASFLSPVFVFSAPSDDPNFDQSWLGFGINGPGNLIAGYFPGSYDLLSNFGPVAAENLNLVQFHDVPTNLGVLSFSSMSPVTFEATVTAPVPEPGTMLLLGSGLVGLAGFRRKFRK